jgi:hypothetical protein
VSLITEQPPIKRAHAFCQSQVSRYRADLQPALYKFAETSKAHADLLTSFPAVAVTLITKRLAPRRRVAALKLLLAGKPLTQIAAALNLPMWLRRVPPEALYTPLPADLDPNDRAFGRLIANAMPPTFRPGSAWLEQVLAARKLCDDEFALWFAHRCWDALRPDLIAPIAAYAWFSKNTACAAHRYVRRRWTSRSALPAIAYEAHLFHVRMILDLQAVEAASDPYRLTGARYAGYEFMALETADALQEEGRIMGHCVADYAERAAAGSSRLFGIRQNGIRLATMEIRYRGADACGIEQISGPRNRKPPDEVLRAAYSWAKVLCSTPGCAALYGPPAINVTAWQIAWRPYVSAKAAEGVTVTPPPPSPLLVMDKTRELMAAAMHC